MLTIKNLSKFYRGHKAIDNINIELNNGEISILIGPNGAGKTTTINCATNFLNYTGEIYINGYKNNTIGAKKHLGYIPDTPSLYEYLTVEEHMEFIAKAYSVINWEEKCDVLLARFNLSSERDKLCKELSKGMKQKVSICCALLHEPNTVIFDEPFVGLDPTSIKELKSLILELKEKGCSVLISTHILDTVNQIWDSAYILNNGKIASHLVKSESKSEQGLEEAFFSLNIDLGE